MPTPQLSELMSPRDLSRPVAPSAPHPSAQPVAGQVVSSQGLDLQRLELQRLAKEVRSLQKGSGTKSLAVSKASISSGCPGMDALLPLGGYEPGSVVEYLRSTPACGASHLAFAAAASAVRASGGYLVVVDATRQIYPPALTCHGIDLQRVIFVHPQSTADLLWSVDQGLRTPAVAAVVAECSTMDDRAARRLQLAAESGSSLGVLIRSIAARRQPTWADVQWVVRAAASTQSPRPAAVTPGHSISRLSSGQRSLYVQLARVRGGGRAGTLLKLEIGASTGAMQAWQVGNQPGSGEVLPVDGRGVRSQHEQHQYHPSSQPSTSHHDPHALRLASQLAHPTRASRRA